MRIPQKKVASCAIYHSAEAHTRKEAQHRIVRDAQRFTMRCVGNNQFYSDFGKDVKIEIGDRPTEKPQDAAKKCKVDITSDTESI